jgi:hypothetical protein
MAGSYNPQNLFLNFGLEGQNLPWQNNFQSFEMVKSISEKASQAVFSFYGVTNDDLMKEAIQANKNFTFRWGNGGNLSIPHNYVIHSADQKYLGDGVHLKLNLIDNRVHMMGNSAFCSYPNMPFHDIVAKIASNFPHLPPAITEPTKFLTNVCQTGNHYWAFLSALQREGCKATKDGSSDYRLYFKGGDELHFHPPDYKQEPYRTFNLFGAEVAPEVNERIAPWKPILGGADGFKTSQFLRDEVRPVSNKSSDPLSLGVTAKPSNGIGAFGGKFFRSIQGSSDLVERDADVGAANSSSVANSLEFSLLGDPGMEPGQIIKLNLKDWKTSSSANADGNWLVEEVHHRIDGSGACGSTKIRVSRTAQAPTKGGSRSSSGVT